MDIHEAIETLKANYPDACYGQLREAVDMAISALKKQIPKQPFYMTLTDRKMRMCGECDAFVSDQSSYCWNCGQRLNTKN